MDTALTVVIVGLTVLALIRFGFWMYKQINLRENNSIVDDGTTGNDVTITSDFEETNFEHNERVNPERYDDR